MRGGEGNPEDRKYIRKIIEQANAKETELMKKLTRYHNNTQRCVHVLIESSRDERFIVQRLFELLQDDSEMAKKGEV